MRFAKTIPFLCILVFWPTRLHPRLSGLCRAPKNEHYLPSSLSRCALDDTVTKHVFFPKVIPNNRVIAIIPFYFLPSSESLALFEDDSFSSVVEEAVVFSPRKDSLP